MDTEQANLSVEQVLGILRRRALWILLCLVVVAAAAYGFSKQQTKKYTATAALSFSSNQLGQQIAGLAATSAGNLQAQQASNLELVRRGDMASRTAQQLGHGLSEQTVSSGLAVTGQGESSIVVVSSTSTSAPLAAAIANTYVKQFVTEQQDANRHFFKSALALVNKQLDRLSPSQRLGTAGAALEDRAHTLGFLSELGYNNVALAQEALVPTSPSSPKTKRNTLLGALVGLLLGLGIALLLERLDRRIREPEDLEAIYGLPMLGVVPHSGKLAAGAGVALPPAEAEAFGLIRAHLRFFNVDREVRTVVIASPAPGEGKSTVARHLAEAAARLGSRVLLVEADLRRPTLARELGIALGPGLTEVLIGAATLGEATQALPLSAARGEGGAGRTLDVLSAGAALPPNPGELLESHVMGGLLEGVRSTYDLVVIDTSPLSAVSDAFPLLTKVDGVVIVGRLGHSRGDVAERLHQVLASSGAPLLGVIANDSSTGVPSPYPTGEASAAPAAGSGQGRSSAELTPTAKA